MFHKIEDCVEAASSKGYLFMLHWGLRQSQNREIDTAKQIFYFMD